MRYAVLFYDVSDLISDEFLGHGQHKWKNCMVEVDPSRRLSTAGSSPSGHCKMLCLAFATSEGWQQTTSKECLQLDDPLKQFVGSALSEGFQVIRAAQDLPCARWV